VREIDSKVLRQKDETIWDAFFKSRIRSYLFWYIVAYVFATIYSCLRYNRPIAYNFFPIKLFPFLLARNMGGLFYKLANKDACSEKKIKKQFEMMFVLFGVTAIVVVALYKITGIDLLWMIL